MNLSGVFEQFTNEEMVMLRALLDKEPGLIPFVDLDSVVDRLQNYLERLKKAPTIEVAKRKHMEFEKVCVLLRKIERHKLKAT